VNWLLTPYFKLLRFCIYYWHW